MMLILFVFFPRSVNLFFLGAMKTMSDDVPAGGPKTASSKVMSPDGGEQLLSSATPSSSQNW